MYCDFELLFETFPDGRYDSLYQAVLQIIPGGTAAYTWRYCSLYSYLSYYDFDLAFVKRKVVCVGFFSQLRDGTVKHR